jgi:hypothetical protein
VRVRVRIRSAGSGLLSAPRGRKTLLRPSWPCNPKAASTAAAAWRAAASPASPLASRAWVRASGAYWRAKVEVGTRSG